MNPALWAVLGATAALLLVLVGVAVALMLGGRRAREREHAALASARADVDALREQVEELSTALAASRGAAEVLPPQTEYVITTAGVHSAEIAELAQVPDRAVMSVTLGEPLVKAAAFGYGVRRALSAESRNRIAFAMRREVKRARKERRRAARRTRLAEARAGSTEEAA
jgi:hypothetical protein